MGLFTKKEVTYTKDDFKILARLFKEHRKVSIERVCQVGEDQSPFASDGYSHLMSSYFTNNDELVYLLAAYYVQHDPGPKPASSFLKYLNSRDDIEKNPTSFSSFERALQSPLEDIPLLVSESSEEIVKSGAPLKCCTPPNGVIIAKWRLEISK